ncbi:MAG: response regulator [Candidatus Eremiobacteraeota bacterium]|nr:response regulator [Candidatus Eremiobacteraeota bacterium]
MPNILIVEDDPHFSSTLVDLLEDNNYQVEAVPSGQEAMARVKRRSFDLVLTDVRIAGPQDGVTALEAIQKIQPNIRSIIMTGYADKEVPVRAARLRADDYLHKPFKLRTLLQALAAVLERETPFRNLFQRVAEAPGQATQRAVRWVFDSQLQKLNTARENCTKELFLLLRANHLEEALAYQVYQSWEQLELEYLGAQSPAQWKSLAQRYENFSQAKAAPESERSVSLANFKQLLAKIMDGRVELVHLFKAVQLLHQPETRRESLEAYSAFHWLWLSSEQQEDPFVGLVIGGYTLTSLRSGDQSQAVRLYEARHELHFARGDLVLCLVSSRETEPLEEQELQSGRARLLERRLNHHFLLYKGFGLTLRRNLPNEGLSPSEAWQRLRPLFLQVREYHAQGKFCGNFSLQEIDCIPGQPLQITRFSEESYCHIHRTRQINNLTAAPEVYEVPRPTAAADQAVLGRILFETIIGANYPDAETRINIRCLGSQQADACLRPYIPRLGPLARPFYLMCQADPGKRYPSLDQAISALDAAIAAPAR